MKSEITIRRSEETDTATIARFNCAMALETENLTLDQETVQAGVANLMERPEYGFYLIAETKGQVVATLLITYEWSDWRNGVCWWIQSVYVEPAYRRHGIFRQMFKHMESLAGAQEGVVGLRLYVEENNTVAQSTYQSLGMEKTPYHLYEKFF